MFSVQIFCDHLQLTPSTDSTLVTFAISSSIPTKIQFEDIIAVKQLASTDSQSSYELVYIGPLETDGTSTLAKIELSIAPEAQPGPLKRILGTQTEHKAFSIILNRSAGVSREIGRSIVNFFTEGLLSDYVTVTVHETEGVDDAARIGRIMLQEGARQDVMLVGGDGTVHEFLNGILIPRPSRLDLNLILIPTGTASALYYSRFPPESSQYPQGTHRSLLYSLISYLAPFSNDPRPLPIVRNILSDSTEIMTAIVTSTSLHASILLDAEALRASIPGLDRFKVAAAQNAENWYDGELILKGRPKLYEIKSKSMRSCAEEQVQLEGPFIYFISTLVDRLEPSFIVAPLVDESIQILLIRPMQSDKVRRGVAEGKLESEIRKEFVKDLWQIVGGIYAGGSHIDLLYEDGTTMVEYYQCSSFSWKPTISDVLKSNLVCLDGALKDLKSGGNLESSLEVGIGLRVW